jgi:hypothetical protein
MQAKPNLKHLFIGRKRMTLSELLGVMTAAQIAHSQENALRYLPSQILHKLAAQGSHSGGIEKNMAIAAKINTTGQRIDLE